MSETASELDHIRLQYQKIAIFGAFEAQFCWSVTTSILNEKLQFGCLGNWHHLFSRPVSLVLPLHIRGLQQMPLSKHDQVGFPSILTF